MKLLDLNHKPIITPIEYNTLSVLDTGHTSWGRASSFYENFKPANGGMIAYSKANYKETFFPNEKTEVGGGELFLSGYNIENLNSVINLFSKAELNKIKEFHLTNGNLRNLEGLERLKELEKLDLSGNQIKILPKSLNTCVYSHVNLSNNLISDIQGIPNSWDIDLSNNQITTFQDSFINSLETHPPISLNLSKNPIKKADNLSKLNPKFKQLLNADSFKYELQKNHMNGHLDQDTINKFYHRLTKEYIEIYDDNIISNNIISNDGRRFIIPKIDISVKEAVEKCLDEKIDWATEGASGFINKYSFIIWGAIILILTLLINHYLSKGIESFPESSILSKFLWSGFCNIVPIFFLSVIDEKIFRSDNYEQYFMRKRITIRSYYGLWTVGLLYIIIMFFK